MDELSDFERDVLRFERQWWRYQGAKDTAIRERFNLSPSVYFLALNGIIDKPAALAFDPMLVKRLTRLRQERRARRTG
jgi:hypothetical protein